MAKSRFGIQLPRSTDFPFAALLHNGATHIGYAGPGKLHHQIGTSGNSEAICGAGKGKLTSRPLKN